MPVDERTFAARVTSWINAILTQRPGLPYDRADVEVSAPGSRDRADFCVYRRGTNQVALSGELKMPDKPYGRNHLDQALIEDAHDKADSHGARFFFSWNVNRFALFETFRVGVGITDRDVLHREVVNIRSSGEVSNPSVEATIKEFWEDLLEEVAVYEAGTRPTPEIPLDQRFIRRLESALEE